MAIDGIEVVHDDDEEHPVKLNITDDRVDFAGLELTITEASELGGALAGHAFKAAQAKAARALRKEE